MAKLTNPLRGFIKSWWVEPNWKAEGGGGEEKREREGEGDQLDLDLIKTSRSNFFPLSLPLLHSIHIVSGSSLRCIAKNAFSSPSSNAA